MDIQITDSDFKIKAHHVGGIEGNGPVDCLEQLEHHVDWIFYDADQTALDRCNTEGKNVKLINKCIAGSNGKRTFHMMKVPDASSLFEVDEDASKWVLSSEYGTNTWGDDTKIIKDIEVETFTLDYLIDNKLTEEIDVLSIDAQGADFEILKGADNHMDDILAVFCEIEFNRLYKDQPLFYDIHRYLIEKGFLMCEIYNVQRFNPAPYPKAFKGSGFATVGEVLFIRDPKHLFKDFNTISLLERSRRVAKLLKLSIISVYLSQVDFANEILNELNRQGFHIARIEEVSNCPYIKGLRDLNNIFNYIYNK